MGWGDGEEGYEIKLFEINEKKKEKRKEKKTERKKKKKKKGRKKEQKRRRKNRIQITNTRIMVQKCNEQKLADIYPAYRHHDCVS